MNKTETIDLLKVNEELKKELARSKQAEERLREERNLLRSLVDSLPDLIYAKDRQGRIIFNNIAHARLVGAARPEKLVGQTVFDLFAETLAQQYHVDEQAVINSGRPLVGREEMMVDADDEQAWFSTTRAPLRDSRGEIIGLAGMSRDITKHKQVEEALRQSNRERAVLNRASRAFAATLSLAEVADLIIERAVQAVKAHSGGLYLLDEQGNLAQTFDSTGPMPEPQAAAAAIFESGEPLVMGEGQPAAELMPAAWLQMGIQAALGLPLTIGRRAIGLLFVCFQQPHRFSEREVDMLLIFANQAALAIEKARLHQETQKQAQQVQQILNTVPDGICLLDIDCRVKVVNPTARQYLDLLAETSIGERLTHLGGQPLAELLVPPRGHQWHEITVAGPPLKIFEAAAQPMDSGIKTEGWVMVLRDVTEERESQEQAQQQERLAAVGKLAAGIAHDFKNMVAAMVGYAELVGFDPNLSDMTRDNLTKIIQQGEQASYFIRQILDFSRRSNMQKQPLDLVFFVEETIQILERTVPAHIDMELKVDPNQPAYVINGDQAQLQRVLTNLAINASDAMPEGGKVQFRLSHLNLEPGRPPLSPDLSPGQWITLAVSDSGMGIPPEVRAHIFEPFFTTKEVGQGTGLGLAQVYGIVKQHGGDIGVESQVGEGTTFTLYLAASSPSPEEPE